MKIKKITKKEESALVYDIGVEDTHSYVLENGLLSHNSYVPTNEISGGSGLKYAASTIVSLGKKKDKDGNDVVGNIIKATTYKSRYSKEQKRVELRLNFTTGLNKYYGLLELAEKYDIIKKTGTRYELPDGSKVFGKKINEDPEKYFTPDIMEKLEEVCKQEFHLGDGEDSYDVEEEIDNIEEGIDEHNPIEDNTTESNT